MKKWIAIGAGALLAVVAAFVAGRYSAPVKVETRTEVRTVTEWKDRVVTKTEQGPVRVRTETREVPGKERVIIRTEDRGPVTTDRNAEGSGSSATQAATVVIRDSSRPGWRASVLAGWSPGRLELRPEVYGVEVSRRVVGTVWAGAWARTDRQFGVSLALEW